MFKWIRWSGFIAFAVITAAMAAFFMLFAGPLTKSALQTLGTQANGAKVELDSVALSFAPLGLRLKNLQVTDAQAPMKNALQFDQAVAELELGPLLSGRAIIKELSVDGLRFNTDRQTSGALAKVAKPKPAADSEPSLGEQIKDSIELPDPKDILARETLLTDQAADALRDSYTAGQAEVEQRLAAVPNQDKLNAYRQEIQALTTGDIKSLEDFQQRQQKLNDIKAAFKQDQAAIEAARTAVQNSKNDLSTKLAELKQAPANDLAHLRSKYQLNASGANNITALLFGEQAGQWAQQTLYWYEKIKPYLDNDGSEAGSNEKPEAQQKRPREGRLVHFKTDNPWPDFLIRDTHMNALLSWGELSIEGNNLTHQQKILGKPAQLVATGHKLANIDRLNAELVLDHRFRPASDLLTLTVTNWQPKALHMGKEFTLSDAKVQIQAKALVSSGQLDASGRAVFSHSKLSATGSSTMAKELNTVLSGIAEFQVDASAKGQLHKPKVSIDSDLDNKLAKAFSARLKDKQAEFEQQLRAELNKKMEAYAGEHAGALNELIHAEGSLNDKLAQVKELGATQLKDYAAEQKDKAKGEAKDKAKEKLKGLF